MLVLSRKVNQRIVLSNGITVTVIAMKGKAVRLGIDAPKDVVILREELVSARDDLAHSDLGTFFRRGTQHDRRD